MPTILVIFGATGDLMRKKIAPALLHLFNKGELPRFFHIFGFSKEDITDSEFRNFIKETIIQHPDFKNIGEKLDQFLKLFSYHKGLFEDLADYKALDKAAKEVDDQWGVCANKLFYLAAPPQFYEPIFMNLASSGLTKPCSEEEGWTRVIVEKPFGKDLNTANKLEDLLCKLFKEVQIYRIDHYLAKEMLQNILAFRFSNNLFENSWNQGSIEKIEVRLWEKLGVEDRGALYDGLGALRDVGQNHILQMLALVAMNNPVDFSAESIRGKREEALKNLIPPLQKEIEDFSFRAQYDGYRDINGVAKDSATETYFKVRAFLSAPKWQGVPIILESGKRLKEQCKEVIITFKHQIPCLCPEGPEHYKNKIIIRLEPEEQIILRFWSKKPGLGFETEERDFNFLLRERGRSPQYTEEYERLLIDCIEGNQTLFVSSEEVKAMWRYIDPILNAWKNNAVPLKTYKPDTADPIVESQYINKSSARIGELKKEIGIVGLGKMGKNMSDRLLEKGWKVLGFDKDHDFGKLVKGLIAPRIVWLMVPAAAVNEVIFGKNGLAQFLSRGDTIIDGGNSFFKDSIVRFKKLKKKSISFVDAGVSGGPEGARHGACLMIGGEKEVFRNLEPLFKDLAQNNGYQFFEGAGAGHFIKMVHNGIEYGYMQAIAEGFSILKKAKYNLNLTQIADVYNHGSVIESRLMSWLKKSFELHGENLKEVTGSVAHTGEVEHMIKTAKGLKVKSRIIESALQFRIQSEKNPSYAGKILSALRQQFGGHSVTKKRDIIKL
ncbi:MAG: glucose-6-phosphate dehydrogenase [Candidatus Nealsonbacteria bacterium]|nr:glucose-6-phosphate dehydrogenase [Candidatus Nealsonbacteria bacterium]